MELITNRHRNQADGPHISGEVKATSMVWPKTVIRNSNASPSFENSGMHSLHPSKMQSEKEMLISLGPNIITRPINWTQVEKRANLREGGQWGNQNKIIKYKFINIPSCTYSRSSQFPGGSSATAPFSLWKYNYSAMLLREWRKLCEAAWESRL